MKRIAQLDGVRGVAIVLVLVWHYIADHFTSPGGTISTYWDGALYLTSSGVELFFVLSGFLIGGILLDHRQTSNYFRVFYLRRACRILPLYFLMLGLFVCCRATRISTWPYFGWLFGQPFPMLSYATFTQNVLMGLRGDLGPHWLGVTWSLAIEEQFYLFIPLLIYFLPRRALVLVLTAGILMAPVLRHFSPGFHAHVNAPWRADSLLSGVLLAVLVRSRWFVRLVRGGRRVLLTWFLGLLVGVAIVAAWDRESGLAGLHLAFILAAFADTPAGLGRLLRFPVLVWFGQRSYGLYLFHEAVSGLCYGLLRRSVPELRTFADVGVTVLAFVVTLLLAELSCRFFESPILSFGRKFHYSPRPPKGSSLPAVTGGA